ncbi:MAG: peptidoglycan-binding protein [Xanthobacteraceae bacterium]|nr:peptidoglycan-binding protein [Xanthobacteraceae bacterium]
MARAIDVVRKVAPGAIKNYSLAFEQGDSLLKQCGLTTPLRLAHFLAQVLHETGMLTIEWESGNYSAERLLEIFGVGHHSAAITPAEAFQLARRPEAIFERVYGLGNPSKAKELGNINPGDGFKYRGGGILQTTGRANYRRMGQKCGVDFEAQPELVISAEHALKPALAEWNENNLNAAADRDDIVTVTRRINGGLNGLNERAGWLAKLKPLIQSVEFADASPNVVKTLNLDEPAKNDTSPASSIPQIPPKPAAVQMDLAHHIIAAMERKGYQIDRGQDEINIVYVEGMNPDGTPNDNEENKWNDLRLLIRFEGGEPRIIGKWAATTEPGRYYIDHPLNPGGAARVEFGQYRAWQVGIHRGDHEALVQTGGPVTVCRDTHRDGFRSDGDVRQTGDFGINQHWGYDLPEVDKASAGCLVGQSKIGHREFMALLKSDPRFQADRKFVFQSALLPEAEVLTGGAVAPGPQTPVASDVREDVRRLQKLLGFSEEDQDGIFGAITNEAVKRAQRRLGLPVTGEMDDKLLDALQREAAGGLQTQPVPDKTVTSTPDTPAMQTLPTPGKPVIPTPPAVGQPDLVPGGGGMNPLILLATRLLPDIARLIIGDKAGTLAGDVIKAVTDVTRTNDPKQAADKLNADPAAADALRLKLAEIAAAQEEKRQQAQLALLKEQSEEESKRQQAQLALIKEQNDQEIRRRDSELAQFRAEIEDTKGARSTFAELALANNPMAWGAPLVSLLVTIGFFGILIILIIGNRSFDNQVAQIVNITVGALAAAFATVVSFWLGSSQGSRAKDAATIQFQAEQVNQSAAQTEALKTTVQAQVKQAEALHATVKSAIAGAPAAATSKLSNFRRCLDIVLGYEGGYSEVPGDPSGATQFGLSLSTLRDWQQNQTLSIDDLKKLARDEACEIYRTRYWNVLRCDDLPIGLDLVVFDFGVDATASRSAKALQQVVGAEADGSIGDATLAATKTMPAADVVKELSNRRLEYYRSLPDAASSARVAINRTTAVEKSALDMIAADRALAA